ncbi:MAG TPA: ABC transporter substrate-binding protein [Casimicrobiaceae bacterium]
MSIDRTRRAALGVIAGAAGLAVLPHAALAQAKKVKIGLMLPYTGTYAQLGTAITNGFKLYIEETGGRLGGMDAEYATVDDESAPPKAVENMNRLVRRDNVDVVVGTVHSGVALAMANVARQTGTTLIIPNAGADDITGSLCAPNIFRTSFTNWQPGYGTGKMMADRRIRTAVTLTWKYAAGDESVNGFKEAFTAGGGKVLKEMTLPFPNVEFQPFLTEIAALKPESVYVFFAGAGAAKFVKDYYAAGLKGIPLYGSGFLTDGVTDSIQDVAQGLTTVLHYGDGIENPKNQAFRSAYAAKFKLPPDVYAVQGYDAAQLLAAGLGAVKGDLAKKEAMYKAMEAAKIDSPRGPFTLSKAHNPVQDMYIRELKGRDNVVTGIAVKALADPARGCKAA